MTRASLEEPLFAEYNDEGPDPEQAAAEVREWAATFYDGAHHVLCDWTTVQEYDDEEGYNEVPQINRLIVRNAVGEELRPVYESLSDAQLEERFGDQVRRYVTAQADSLERQAERYRAQAAQVPHRVALAAEAQAKADALRAAPFKNVRAVVQMFCASGPGDPFDGAIVLEPSP